MTQRGGEGGFEEGMWPFYLRDELSKRINVGRSSAFQRDIAVPSPQAVYAQVDVRGESLLDLSPSRTTDAGTGARD